jgi:hypothetical protein
MQAVGTGLGSTAFFGNAAAIQDKIMNGKIEMEEMDGENSYELECSRMMCSEGYIDDVEIIVKGGTVENLSIGGGVMNGEEMDDEMTERMTDGIFGVLQGLSEIAQGESSPAETVTTLSNALVLAAPLL